MPEPDVGSGAGPRAVPVTRFGGVRGSAHRIAPVALLAAVVLAFGLGAAVRSRAEVELSVESIRHVVQGLGATAPLVFLLLIVFRNFLMLPSFLMLTTGGLLFGVGLGTLVGGLGVLISGLGKCAIVRVLGREWVRPRLERRLGDRLARVERRLATAGPLIVGLNTGHPVGILSPLHWGYGLTDLPWVPFAVALALAAPLRAFFCAYFGSTLLDPGSQAFYLATGILLACILGPLAIPSVRRRLLLRSLPRSDPGSGGRR